jgi:hypothetical protein
MNRKYIFLLFVTFLLSYHCLNGFDIYTFLNEKNILIREAFNQTKNTFVCLYHIIRIRLNR